MSDEPQILFSELGLPEPLIEGVENAGFKVCTPIQAQTLPFALKGIDIAGQAQTGTGKTAAFLLAAFNYMLTHERTGDGKKPSPRAVMIAPTRELAIQIHADALILGKSTGFKIEVVFGGADYEKQRENLERGVDVLIGTPGRLIDYFKQGVFTLNHVDVIVLDEADRMFDLGFIKDIRYVMRRLPPPEQRLNLLFSATLNQRVLELAYEHMNEPQTVRIEPDKLTVDEVTQIVYFPGNNEKGPLLVSVLRSMEAVRTMVFVNTKREAEYLARLMQANELNAEAISGDVPQKKRMRMLRDFQSGTLPVLIATDVASRGLHVPDVSHVVNYDLPHDAEDYVHRIGRTARAGATGDAISFACETYAFTLPEIESYIGHRIPTGNFKADELPKLKKPAYKPRSDSDHRKKGGGRPRRSGSGGGNSSGRGRSRRGPRGPKSD
jgi:ATP-dependent RNA helicase RhlB